MLIAFNPYNQTILCFNRKDTKKEKNIPKIQQPNMILSKVITQKDIEKIKLIKPLYLLDSKDPKYSVLRDHILENKGINFSNLLQTANKEHKQFINTLIMHLSMTLNRNDFIIQLSDIIANFLNVDMSKFNTKTILVE